MANAPTPTTRPRVPRDVLCTNWDGSGAVSKEMIDHEGLAQHVLSVNFNSTPSAGVLRVEGRPVGSGYFVAVARDLAAVSVASFDSIALPFIGYFDAFRLRFTTGLAGATQVSAVVHSSGTELGPIGPSGPAGIPGTPGGPPGPRERRGRPERRALRDLPGLRDPQEPPAPRGPRGRPAVPRDLQDPSDLQGRRGRPDPQEVRPDPRERRDPVAPRERRAPRDPRAPPGLRDRPGGRRVRRVHPDLRGHGRS